jgi:hypothetical protein
MTQFQKIAKHLIPEVKVEMKDNEFIKADRRQRAVKGGT